MESDVVTNLGLQATLLPARAWEALRCRVAPEAADCLWRAAPLVEALASPSRPGEDDLVDAVEASESITCHCQSHLAPISSGQLARQ